MNLCASSLALFEGTGEMLLNLSKLEDQQKKYKAPNWLALRKLKSFLMKMQAQIKKKTRNFRFRSPGMRSYVA